MSTAQAIIERPEPAVPAPKRRRPPAAAAALTPMEMAFQLIQGGADVGAVKEMLAMSKELAAEQAERAFSAALADAKGEIPVILKNREVDFTSSKGRTHYRHEDLAEIARTVDPILKRHGLSYRFRTEQDGAAVTVTCVVAHRDGHSETNTLSANRDESGNKNTIQAVGSTITYLQRYTLKAALGLAASNDDDGRKHGATPEDDALVNIEQIDRLRTLITEVGGSEPVFCKYFKIAEIQDLPASQFTRAVAALEAKRAKP